MSSMPGAMDLHDAILRVLHEAHRGMTNAELADAVTASGYYERRDGNPVPPNQISARTRKARYRDLFRFEDGRIFPND
jgi:hypothetical protein